MAKRPNISIIVLDTLKLDTFNRLVEKNPAFLEGLNAIRFEKCIAPASWTLPSHASIFTGMYPSEHYSHETKKIKSLDIENIKLRKKTITEELKEMGYKTYGISANPYIHPIYGFEGFDEFVEESYFTDIFGSSIEIPKRLKPLIAKYREKYGNSFFRIGFAMLRDDPMLITETAYLPLTGILSVRALAKKLNAKLIEGWPIEKGGKNILKKVETFKMNKPFFLFVNFMEAHDPYIGKKGMDFNWATPFLKEETDSKIVERWKRLYDKASYRALKYGTELIRNLIDRFGENQIIVLTSDHGQAFNEHGFTGHGTVLFDEVVKVPLTIILPKNFPVKKDKGHYQSLVNLRSFIFSSLAGEPDSIEKLSSKTVYAETFSIPANVSNVKNLDKRKMAKFDRYERRVFK